MRLVVVAALVLASTATAWAARPVEVTVDGVRLDLRHGTPIVVLVEKGGQHRALNLTVGFFEAQAIAVELQGIAMPRPMPHDLMKRIVGALGAELDHVEIAGRDDDDVYLAFLHLRDASGEPVRVDARPSDAIALAVRLRRPIEVAAQVFPRAEMAADGSLGRVWGMTVQPLTPALADALGTPGARGVLVSQVDRDGPARRLRPGDVIEAIDARPVRTPIELAAWAEHHDADQVPQHVGVRRGRHELQVRLRPPHR
jgi:bifunctional DNase/RNase